MSDARYQFQSWYVKAWRQVRYRPIGWFLGAFDIARWIWVDDCYIAPEMRVHFGGHWGWPNRKFMRHLWEMRQSEAAFKMQWYFSADEVFKRKPLQSELEAGK